MVEIRAHSPRELQSKRKVCGGCVQVHFTEECFSRAFHMEGCRRRLIPGPFPTIRKIKPGKQSSKRQHRKPQVSLVQFILASVLCQPWSFLFRRSILYVYSQTSLRFGDIFSSNSVSLELFILPHCCILVFYPFCLSQSCGTLGRCWFTEELFNGFQNSFQINQK